MVCLQLSTKSERFKCVSLNVHNDLTGPILQRLKETETLLGLVLWSVVKTPAKAEGQGSGSKIQHAVQCSPKDF